MQLWLLEYLASEKFVLASESNLSLAAGLASWKVSLQPCFRFWDSEGALGLSSWVIGLKLRETFKEVIMWWRISWSYTVWQVNPQLSGKVLHSFFASLSSFVLSSKIQFKICNREKLEECKIHYMDKIYLQLDTFEGFVTAVLQTIAKRCLSSYDHFFESVAKTSSMCVMF